MLRSIFWGFEDIADDDLGAAEVPVLCVAEDLRSASAAAGAGAGGRMGLGMRMGDEEKWMENWGMKGGNDGNDGVKLKGTTTTNDHLFRVQVAPVGHDRS